MKYAYCLAIWLVLAGSLHAQTFPTGWVGYATHSVTTEPASNLTDFTFLVSLNQLPADFWTNVQTDGDDIRVTSDAAGTTELPVDIILFTDSGSSGSGLIAVKYSGTKSSSVDQKIYIWAGNGSATRPADTDTYGRENAYASHVRAFWPSGAGTDRTSFDNDLTMTGSPTDGGTAGPINGSTATDYNGTSQYGSATASVPGAHPMTLIAWANSDNNSLAKSSVTVADTAGASNYYVMQDRGADTSDPIYATMQGGGAAYFASSATGFTISTWGQRLAVFATSTSRYAGINGVLGAQDTNSATASGVDTMTVGAYRVNTLNQYYDGDLSLVKVHDTALSADWLAYEKEMLDDTDQSDFFGTWSWTASAAAIDPLSTSIPGSSADPLTGTIPGL